MRSHFYPALFVLFFSLPASSKDLTWDNCNDGDTCTFFEKSKKIRVRLVGIDAPEKGQDQYTQARNFLRELMKKGPYELDCTGQSFDRKTCHIKANSVNVALEMVKNGYAWDYPKYSKGKYTEAQRLAQKEKKGIWRAQSPTSPHCHRHRKDRKCKAFAMQYQP